MTTIKKNGFPTLVLFLVLSITSCKKDNFDEPPASPSPNIVANLTIAELKALYTGGSPITVTEDIIIEGIVVGDDRTGNIYKQIIIDDGTAGIPILIESYDLYGLYPEGRKIYVKCKDLVLGTYGGVTQMGGYANGVDVGRIPATLQDKYIVRGALSTPLQPIEVAISDLNDAYLSRLIILKDVEFSSSASNIEYANVHAVIPDDGDRILTNCTGAKITVRTSPYATFAFAKTPRGKGDIIGIYSRYNSTKQLTVRDTSEVQLKGIKCDGTDPNAVVVYEETFESYSNGVTSIGSWVNQAVAGTKVFKVNNQPSSANNKYVQMSAFGSPAESSNITWFISPDINFDASTNEKLSFSTAIGFPRAGTLFEVFITNNYTGNPTTTTWTSLSARIAEASDIASGNFSPFIPSGAIDVSSLSGNVVIAFRYTGSGTSNLTSTYELDNVRVYGE